MLPTVLMGVDDGFGRTKEVGQRLHMRIHGIDPGGSDQQLSPHPLPMNTTNTDGDLVQATVVRSKITVSNEGTITPLAFKSSGGHTECQSLMACVSSEFDVEEDERRYVIRALQQAEYRELQPSDVLMDLYHNTYMCIADILDRNEQHWDRMARSARVYLQMKRNKGDKSNIPDGLKVTQLLEELDVPKMWEDTNLLLKIVNCLPKKEKLLAAKLLQRYEYYLRFYYKASKLKDYLEKGATTDEQIRVHVPQLEITSVRDLDEITRMDCKDMVVLLVYEAYKIPLDEITADRIRSGNSTTITFLINKAFMQNIIQYSAEKNALWAYQELRVTRVRIPGLFELNVTQLLAQNFKVALLSGLTGNMDFVRATKALPYQVYALVDPDTANQLQCQTVHCEILRPWSEQEESVDDSVDNEGVELAQDIESLSGHPLGTRTIAQHLKSHDNVRAEANLSDAGQESVDEQPLTESVEGEEETKSEGKESEADGIKLRSRVQELEDKLKKYEQTREELIHDNTALELKLKASQMEEGRVRQEMANLKERLLPVLRSQTEGKPPLKAEEVKQGDEGNELLSRVQELEDELKKSEESRFHDAVALQNKLKASQEELDRVHQEMTSLNERLLQVDPPPIPNPPLSTTTHPPPPPPEPAVQSSVNKLAAQAQQMEDLESEISALQKKLTQQTEKYDHDMEMITQSLSTSNPVKNTMLQAASMGSQPMVQRLVKQLVNVEDKGGRTPLLIAAEKGYIELVRKLAGQYDGDIFHTMKNSRNALHLAAYRGHLPVLQYLCPMFGDRALDKDGNGETCLDIARRLGRDIIAEFLIENYPQLERKGDSDRDSWLTLKRAHRHRWWLKASDQSCDVALPPSSSMELAEGNVNIQMEGQVEFSRESKSNLIKAVSGTEWMYRRGALERGRQAAAATHRLNQFTRYHQRWLADSVHEEEEESCEQWLLHQSPEMTTEREAEEYRPGRVRYRYATTKGLPAEREGNIPPKVEEKGQGDKGKEKRDDDNELLSHVQELESELKKSEENRFRDTVALQNKLKASRDEVDRVHQEMTSLKERLLQVDPPPVPNPPLSTTTHSPPPPPELAVQSAVNELAAQAQQMEDLESENSVLQKKLTQQTEKYDHDMEMITHSLSTSNPVTNIMLQAASMGSQPVVQRLVKQFVNVEDKGGRTPLLIAAEKGHNDFVRKLAGQYDGDIFHKMKNSRNALHLAAYRGHLPVLQYLCPMFGDRVLDRDDNDETCLDIAHRLRRAVIAEFLTENCPQLERKQSDACRDSQLISKRVHRHRWWLKGIDNSQDVALSPSLPMEQAEENVQMEGEVEFKSEPKSKLIKAVSGTLWMYRRRALERGRQAAATTRRQHQFTSYHQRWLADNVQEEDEESCKQLLLHQSPDMTTAREAEEYRPGRVRYRYTTGVEFPAEEYIKMPAMPNALPVISSALLENKVYVTGFASEDDDRLSIRRQVQVYALDGEYWATVPGHPILKPAPNYNVPMAVINGQITLIGGRDAETDKITNMVSTWFEIEQQWKQILPPMPTERLESGICYHNSLLLVTGGVLGSTEMIVTSTVDVYNFNTGCWSTPQALQLPKPLRSHHIVVFGGNIYLIGGVTVYATLLVREYNHQAWRAQWSDVEEAVMQPSKPVKSVWTPVASPPVLRPTVITCNNSLYSVGGIKEFSPHKGIYKFVDRKDRTAWIKVGNMRVGRYRHGVVPLENYGTALFIVGGFMRMAANGDESCVKTACAEIGHL